MRIPPPRQIVISHSSYDIQTKNDAAAPRSHDYSKLVAFGDWSGKRVSQAFGASFRSLDF
jgi:hypothetical protein